MTEHATGFSDRAATGAGYVAALRAANTASSRLIR
jgi:hypothetical protein